MTFKKEVVKSLLEPSRNSQILYTSNDAKFTIESTSRGIRFLGTSEHVVDGKDLNELAQAISEAYKNFLVMLEVEQVKPPAQLKLL